MNIKFEKFEEQVFFNTVLIENLTDGEFGTGFVLAKPSENQGRRRVVLCSNKHVFWGKKDKLKDGIQKRIRITYHVKESDGSYKLGKVKSLEADLIRDPKVGYYDHPNPLVDVACANISHLFNGEVKLNLLPMNRDDFFTTSRSDLASGMRVFFVGYPSGFYDKKHCLPVMRSGTIASIPSVDFNGEPQILIDAQIFPGSSGSPVFIETGGKYSLIGIVSDGIRRGLDTVDIQKTSNENSPVISVPIEWMGLGLLFTVDVIKEALDLV